MPSDYTLTGPTEVIRDPADGYTEVLTMSATPHLTNGAPDGTEAITGLQTLTRDYTNAAGQVTAEDDYFNLTGLAYSTAVMGAVNVNFYQTQYGYDSGGRLVRRQTPNGTIYRTVYNSLGEAVSDWVGTNDTPASGEWSPSNNTSPSNMVEVSSYQYDGGGVGDGDLTQETDYPGLGAANRVTQNWYDWRDRLVATKSGVQASESDGTNRPIFYYTYDNLDEVTETQQYSGDGVTLTVSGGVPQPPAANLLRAQEIDSYDDQGRVYQTQVYDVNPSTGAVSSTALTTNYYYNHRGELIAKSAPGGLWTKSVYDGAGRDVFDYTTDGAGGTTWAAAGSVANDTVLEQVQTVYDSDSNAIETIDSQRFHNDTATQLGPLGSPTSGIGARVYYTASYYDNADRLIASVDPGTNGGTAWTRPSTVPSSSATLLVTNYAYNAAGWVQDVTDPQGIDNRTLYDNLGRVTQTIQDYTGGTPGTENDITTEYGYDTDNNFQYGYNQDGDVLYRQNLVDAVFSELYSYDNLNQLTSFQRGTLNSTHNGIVGTPSRSQNWTPDALGNFTGVTTGSSTQTETFNQQNEIATISGQGNPTYDANGNLTADGSGNTYVYDAWNCLVAVKNGSTTLASYGYDGLDRRITETHSTTTTDLYYSSSWQVLEEDVGGVVQARNVWSPAGVDTLVLRDQSSQHNGTLDQRLYVQQDANGNVTALVDTSGNVVERYEYDPYGAVTVLAPDFSTRSTSSYGWLYFFQGKRYDGAVGLYDSRERVYSPTLMRPLQVDPLGLGPDKNAYRWEGNGPTDGIDPSGLEDLIWTQAWTVNTYGGAYAYNEWRYDHYTIVTNDVNGLQYVRISFQAYRKTVSVHNQ